MKTILRKLLFWDDPAKGAFFALTWLFVASHLWYTLFQTLWMMDSRLVQLNNPMNTLFEGHEGVLCAWVAGQLAIALYSAVVFLRALWSMAVTSYKRRRYLPLAFACVAAALCLLFALYSHLPFAQLWVWVHGFFVAGPTAWMELLAWLPCEYWGMAFYVIVLCTAVFGFLTILAFVSADGKKLRNAVGKASAVLWGIYVTTYVVFLGLAMMESRRTASTRAALETHFGYPLSAAGLQDYYRTKGETDDDFWKQLRENMLKLANQKFQMGEIVLESWNWQLPEQLTPDVVSAFDAYWHANEEALSDMEKSFDTIPPLPSFDFRQGNVVDTSLDGLIVYRTFAKMELARLGVWLVQGNVAEALGAYRRLANCSDSEHHQPFLIGGLVWLGVEHYRLDAMERLLESRLLTDDDLRRLDDDLTAIGKQIPDVERHAMFTEAVLGQDCLWGMETGNKDGIFFPFASLRWLCPQLWLQAVRDKHYMLQVYFADGFDSMVPPPTTAYVFSMMMVPALRVDKFMQLRARVLAMKTLLRAEEHRRRHGDFPDTLPDMPGDPFADKPLHYQYGIVELPVVSISDLNNPFERHDAESHRQVKCVQVWSVGKNGQDDGGNRVPSHDLCARIRLE